LLASTDTILGGLMRILIVEDHPAVGSFCARALQRAGFDARSVTTSRQALGLITKHAPKTPFDVVVADRRLEHDTAGDDLLIACMEQHYGAALVLMTAYPDANREFEHGRRGLDAFIVKPFRADAFVNTVRLALARHQERARSRGGKEPPPGELAALDAYGRWVEAMLAVVAAPHDVAGLEFWPSALPTARSLAAIRHWCRAVGLPAGASLDLARCLRALVQGRATGRDPRKLLTAATRETSRRFWRRAGEDDLRRLPGSLGEWLKGQQFVTDLDALEALREALQARFPDLS
jgi:CheY-like chemotaxis protein